MFGKLFAKFSSETVLKVSRVKVVENLRPWSSWTVNSDKKYMELNGAALNVNIPCVTSWKTAFLKDK